MNTKYDPLWTKVQDAFSKGLNASAEKDILTILKMAKSEENTEQLIKAICHYRISLRDRDEKARLNDILFFEKELSEARFPAKQLLHSMLGDLYWTYYQENRWQILDRTLTYDQDIINHSSKLETWAAQNFYEKASQHYHLSLESAKQLQLVKITSLSVLVDQGTNTTKLRPTLFDFLVFRAIDYFKQQETDITKPSYAFEIRDEISFAPADQFKSATFVTSDTTSRKYQVLKLYQQIIMFHASDEDNGALLDADLQRLNFVHELSIHPKKEDLYVKALQVLIRQYPINEYTAMANYYLAESYCKLGAFNARTTDEKGTDYVKAKSLLDAIVRNSPNSEAKVKSQILLLQIENHTLNMQHEQVVIPNQPSLALVTFKNIPKLFIKLIKLGDRDYMEKGYEYQENMKTLLSKKAMQSWEQVLPIVNDYKTHTTEIKINALPIGAYAIILSESEQFLENTSNVISFLQVSNLALISASNLQQSKTNYSISSNNLFVMDRSTGQPLPNVKVKTWMNDYDYNQRKYILKAGEIYTTNADGYVKPNKVENGRSFTLELISGDDHLYLKESISTYEYNQKVEPLTRTFLFTDRSIYRLGQQIYFKGITVHSKGERNKDHELIKNQKVRVFFYDANEQLLKDEEFSSNQYGSFAGSFQAPEGMLTGEFKIRTEYGQANFSIEEYKRPKFEVNFDSLKGTYSLFQSVKVNGIAKAYAGNAIDGAMVKYRVYRAVRFPYFWCYYSWGRPSSPEMEMTHGVTTTNKDGSFTVEFTALPDESIDKRTKPVFDYRIEADVTDLNGETRSNKLILPVSYQAIVLNIELPENSLLTDLKKAIVHSTNLNGVHVTKELSVSFKKLKAVSKTYKSRLWPKPELLVMTEESFRKDFPDDEFGEENDYKNWPIEKTVWTQKFISTKDGEFVFPQQPKESGWYIMEARTLDTDGEEILDKKYIRLISSFGDDNLLPNEHLLISTNKEKYALNDLAQVAIQSTQQNVWLLYNAQFKDAKIEWIHFSKNKKLSYALTESNYGGFALSGVFVKNNRVYTMNGFIDMPWQQKELKLSLETFRDKMFPGSEQEWKIKISGHQSDPVSAELLATMYDASLDAYKMHQFEPMHLFQTNHYKVNWDSHYGFNVTNGQMLYYPNYKEIIPYNKVYSQLQWWGLNVNYSFGMHRDDMMFEAAPAVGNIKHLQAGNERLSKSKMPAASREEGMTNDEDMSTLDASAKVSEMKDSVSSNTMNLQGIQLRTNFQETAFFFPQLETDASGSIILKFKAPDALTRWKLLGFAHTQTLQSGLLTGSSLTQKELMIVPNTPRFLREGDQMIYSAKITNLSDKDLNGSAILQLLDAGTEQPIDGIFQLIKANTSFEVKKGQSTLVYWNMKVPMGFTNPVIVKTYASASIGAGDQSATFTDGEQNVLPVLLNSMLVTETLPLPVRMNSSKEFKFDKLLNSSASSTLRHYNLSLEYTSNPAWYAIQSLPYLTDYPYECSEQTMNRYYANVLATHIANSSPAIKTIFEQWKEKEPSALLSNLQKNQSLKSAILQETPWVMEAKNEEEQKRRIAQLFDMNRMSIELEQNIRELQLLQTPNGGFAWFKGMPDDRFITQYILTALGRLSHIGITETRSDQRIYDIILKALPYLDARIKEDYDALIKEKADLTKQHISHTQIQYLYMRSFFLDLPVADPSRKAFEYFKKQAATFWLIGNRYMQGMTALALHRFDNKTQALAIIKSLRENAVRSEEMGMYWKEVMNSYWWYEAPIETQSLLVEAFTEIGKDEVEVDELKIWLLKNKQTQHWKTTKATADACYALLLNGTDWLGNQPQVDIQLGSKLIQSSTLQKESGTGYFKVNYPSTEIEPAMGNIKVKVSENNNSTKQGGTTWGAVYWQYFENLDKITAAETPLKLHKQLYVEQNTSQGPLLVPLNENRALEVGDKIKVRIELRVDRDMEYVHMKDMRAACFEPVNVISNYKYQGGLGYYESTRDAATNFFFYWLAKGTYVFEYPMFVTHKGNFSNGITSIQCMYAPEFSSHSEGLRVEVK